MDFRKFKQIILLALKEAGFSAKGIKFKEDTEKGLFIAFHSGVCFTGNFRNDTITAKWASHTAVFKAADIA